MLVFSILFLLYSQSAYAGSITDEPIEEIEKAVSIQPTESTPSNSSRDFYPINIPIPEWMVLSGNVNRSLAEGICERMGKQLGNCVVSRFSDGEVSVKINENIRGRHVYIVQSTCRPVNDNLMELLSIADALKRGSVSEITALIPYFGYARQDRRSAAGTPISAKLVADLIQTAGVTRAIAMDLHSNQIQGFFNIPMENISGVSVLVEYFKKELNGIPLEEIVVVSPDAGGLKRARSFAECLGVSLAVIDKMRTSPNQAKAMSVIGEVQGKIAIILDDMIDTAGTLVEAGEMLKRNGAVKVFAAATHGVFSGEAVSRIQNSEIERVVVTDTIPLSVEASHLDKIVQLTVAEILANAIREIHYCGNSSSFSYH
jgi:ribose-phosphate pyrophosphokinase